MKTYLVFGIFCWSIWHFHPARIWHQGPQPGNYATFFFQRYLEGQEDSSVFKTLDEATQELLTGRKKALFFSVESLMSQKDTRCEIRVAWQSRQSEQMAFALPKDSPYYEFMQYNMIRLLETGTWKVCTELFLPASKTPVYT